jgi:hypothetical protein
VIIVLISTAFYVSFSYCTLTVFFYFNPIHRCKYLLLRVSSSAPANRDDSKLGQLLRLSDEPLNIPFKQTEKEFEQPRQLCKESNLSDVIRDRADVIRAYLAAVWKRYAMLPREVRYRFDCCSSAVLSTLDLIGNL